MALFALFAVLCVPTCAGVGVGAVSTAVMQAGFAMIEAGLVSSGSVVNILFKVHTQRIAIYVRGEVL